MKIKLVKQEHKNGCGIACIAMVLGKSYSEVVKDFKNDFEQDGMRSADLMEYLAYAGYSVVFKEARFWGEINFARDEMMKPFAPIHIVSIKWRFDTSWHFVVMDEKGKFYCPSGKASSEEIANSYAITEVIGLYK